MTSTDGTEIALERSGEGRPLVLVNGGTATHHSWRAVRPHLDGEFEVIAPDRRGRGGSGDEYGLSTELEDVRAVVDSLDEPPVLFGHSFGGLVALETAREVDVERLVLYEPAILTDENRDDDDLADRMAALVEDGDRRGAVKLFFREAGGVEDPEALPGDRAAAIVETVIRENRAIEGYHLGDELDATAPALLLAGEHGPGHLGDATRAVHGRLPGSRLVQLPGVGHLAVHTAPERLAAAVLSLAAGELRTADASGQ